MISEKLYNQIEAEGKRKGFKIRECYGIRDNYGNFEFIIKLVPTDMRDTPPPLGVSVKDGVGTEDKFGG